MVSMSNFYNIEMSHSTLDKSNTAEAYFGANPLYFEPTKYSMHTGLISRGTFITGIYLSLMTFRINKIHHDRPYSKIQKTNLVMKNLFKLLGLLLMALITNVCKTDKSPSGAVAMAEEPVKQWNPEDTRSITAVYAKRGLIKKSDMATSGYLLFQPSSSTSTYLEGWGPLCSFLGVSEPQGELPHLNKKENFREMLGHLMKGEMV